jgi:glycosyltransferase involved in cell wall biosynthesis
MIDNITFIVIGKNEALNLPRCFSSILKITDNIIFVDSDSVDDSIEIATQYKIKTILRVKSNYGFPPRSIGAKEVQTKYIQFVDGDMTIERSWVQKAIHKLESNNKIAVVHGYKKVFTKNDQDYFILSDSKDWQADYLGGAFMINREIYYKSGGLDERMFGEEERDLYVRIRALGYQVWYIHHLMASHYDLKEKKINNILFSDRSSSIWIPLVKAIKNNNIRSYLFVYRRLLIPLLLDVLTILSIFLSLEKFIFCAIVLQTIELLYCWSIKRKGYFILWKIGFINIIKAIKVYRRDIVFKIERF